MNKLKMESVNMTEHNIDRIAELFPQVMTEVADPNGVKNDDGTPLLKKAIDFVKLKMVLSAGIGDYAIADDDSERYDFTWVGKRQAMIDAATPIRKTLRPCPEESKNWETTENLYIEGDNLEVLKLLQESYLGKVKMIYIDPPYNTGNDFIYKDNFSKSREEYEDELDMFDEEGNRLFQNTETNGRFHSDWCSMIYPRLQLARNLLTDDGVVFISIDEVEVNNLQKICDEVFGATNFVSQLVWAAGRKNDSKYISVSHEFILCYVKDMNHLKEHNILWREKKHGLEDIYAIYEILNAQYKDDTESKQRELRLWYRNLPEGHPAKDHKHYSRVDNKGIYFAADISWPGGGGPKYEVLHPITHKPVTIPSRGWITSEKNLKEWISEDRVDFGPNETYVPTVKAYLKEREYSVPYSVFYKDGRAASKRLATLMGDKVFENPKDEEIIQRMIEFCGVSNNDIILDFFSGSGTTAHSAMLASVAKNISIHYILVQLPEEINEKKASSEKSKKVAKSAIKLCDELNVPHSICEIGKERIRRAGAKIESELTSNNGGLFAENNKKIDTGFRVFKTDTTNMKDVYYAAGQLSQKDLWDTVSNIKDDRSDIDLLYGCLLDWGVQLTLPHTTENIEGFTVHTVDSPLTDEIDLIACFDSEVSESVVRKIAKRKPIRALFRDSSFADSANKINVFEIFKSISPDTTVKVL